MNRTKTLADVAKILKKGKAFILTTHKDPDGDGIGSMLALGFCLGKAGKQVSLLLEEAVPVPFDILRGADRITQDFDADVEWSGVVVLDCADEKRLGGLGRRLAGVRPWINIDHHETNSGFAEVNLIVPKCSSTGELVYGIIKECGFPMDLEVAENLFAAIQTDTGSFRYDNTTSRSMRIAAELIDLGVNPWEVTQKVMDGHDLSRLKLLRLALGTIELHHEGRIGIIVLTKDMFEQTGAGKLDSERFVDFVRFIRGVEIAALIRETEAGQYKFSLRSNNRVNVAKLASLFGGGGHEKAAGFDCRGDLKALKEAFTREAERFLNGRF